MLLALIGYKIFVSPVLQRTCNERVSSASSRIDSVDPATVVLKKDTRVIRSFGLEEVYPRRKMYKSFEDYLDQECYAVLNEETGKYGEWFNPDGVYDWYSIGGRWPAMFLVILQHHLRKLPRK